MSEESDYLESIIPQVVAAFTSGADGRDIVRKFRIAPSTLYSILRQQGVPLRRDFARKLDDFDRRLICSLFEKKFSVRAIAQHLEISRALVYDTLHDAGVKLARTRAGARFLSERRFTPDQEAEICRLYAEKEMTAAQIAKLHNVSTNTIYAKLREAGIERRNFTGPKMRFVEFRAADGRVCRFRSQWEKRFAQHLDDRGLEWTYESHTYILSDGTTYTPDFWIPDWNVLIEVKGYMVARSRHKIELFRNEYPHRKLLVLTSKELALYGIDLAA